MRFIDTHTHLYDEQFSVDSATIIQQAINNGVEKMYLPNCDSSTIKGMLQLEENWEGNCFSMMGLHPCYVKENVEEELQIVKDWLAKRKFYAVGEIGLDKHWDLSFLNEQILAFEMQIDWALKYDLPIVIHSRASTQDCIDIVRKKQYGQLKGIFHCFSGTIEEAKQITELGFFLGIGGVVTFKNNTLQELVKEISLDYLVLETDAPYLAPMPYRGKRNESSYIPLIAEKIATLKNTNIEEVARITTFNAEKVFGNSFK